MKKFKSLISLMLVLSLVISLALVSAYAVEDKDDTDTTITSTTDSSSFSLGDFIKKLFGADNDQIVISVNKELSITDVLPSDYEGTTPTVTSSDESVIKVWDNKIQTLKVGTATLTVTLGISTKSYNVRVAFTDVADNSKYFFDPVYWAFDKGVTSGTTDTTFTPDGPCTRAQIVTFIYKLNCDKAGTTLEPYSSDNPFSDLSSSAYYYKAVLWAYYNGIVSGFDDGTFKPNKTCTRAQAMTFLYKCQTPDPGTNDISFTDVTTSNYYYDAVKWAVNNNVTAGTTDTTFSPNNLCTRKQILTFLYKCKDSEVYIFDNELSKNIDEKVAETLKETGSELEDMFDFANSGVKFTSTIPASITDRTTDLASYGFDNKKGNAFVKAAVFYKLAIACGYDAHIVNGNLMGTDGSYTSHAWVEITKNGKNYEYDPTYNGLSRSDGTTIVGYEFVYGTKNALKYFDYKRIN